VKIGATKQQFDATMAVHPTAAKNSSPAHAAAEPQKKAAE